MLMLRGASLLAAVSAAAVLLPSAANAAATITITELPGLVVTATLSGNISNAFPSAVGFGGINPGIAANSASVAFTAPGGFPGGSIKQFLISGPLNFAAGGWSGWRSATASSGDLLYLWGGGDVLYVDSSYSMGSALNATETITDATFAAMGLKPGTYVYGILGPQGPSSDTLTVQIGPVATGGVPEPTTWAMMLLGFGGIGFAMRRRKLESVLKSV